MRTLIVGGARSGKSALAERLAGERAAARGLEVVMIVTAEPRDAEMAARIAAHRAQRPPHWRTVEAPLGLAATLQRETAPQRLLVVDCLTLWLSNALLADAGPDTPLEPAMPAGRWADEAAALLATLPALPGELLFIGNEVGHGIVPLGALNRRFVDENGRLHQRLAAVCDEVLFVMAGCVLPMKPAGV